MPAKCPGHRPEARIVASLPAGMVVDELELEWRGSGRLGLLRGRAGSGLGVHRGRRRLGLSRGGRGLRVRGGSGLRMGRTGRGLGVRLGGRGLLASGAEDALGHVHYAVGAVTDLVEAFEELLDPDLEPLDGITTRIHVLRAVRAAVRARRLGVSRR
jgi:hypothetical protein